MQKIFFLLLGLQAATHSMEGKSESQITSSVSYQSISSKELGMQELKEDDHFRNHKPEEARNFVRHHVVLELESENDGELTKRKKLVFEAKDVKTQFCVGCLEISLPNSNDCNSSLKEIYITSLFAEKAGYGLSILSTFIKFVTANKEFEPQRTHFSLSNCQSDIQNKKEKVFLYDVLGFSAGPHTIECFNGEYDNRHHNKKINISGEDRSFESCKFPSMYLERD
jgi:hypothetical protein